MEHKPSMKDRIHSILDFIKRRKGSCLVAVALVLVAVIFLANSNIETVQQHEERVLKEAQERREALADNGEKEQKLQGSAMEKASGSAAAQGTATEAAILADGGETVNKSGQFAINGQRGQLAANGQIGANGPDSSASQSGQNIASANGSTEAGSSTSVGSSQPQNGNSQPSGQNPVPGTDSPAPGEPSPPVTEPSQPEQAYIMVTVKIVCDKVIGHPDLSTSAALPEDGVIISARTAVKKDGTVFEALDAVCKDHGIPYVNQGSPSSAYITGIGGLLEKECGRYSGWKYKVNGVIANKACSSQKLQENDEILWYYVVNFMD